MRCTVDFELPNGDVVGAAWIVDSADSTIDSERLWRNAATMVRRNAARRMGYVCPVSQQ